MVIPLVFQLMILLSSLTLAQKLDCAGSCGNDVVIAHPFGIGDGCYLDEWFAIECISDKPFLKNIKHGNNSLEVLGISLENSTVVVNHRENKTCQNRNISVSANLTNSPFFFSRTENVLTGLGCDNFARIHHNGTVAGCYSSCGLPDESETEETTGCLGTKCCQTKIPLVLQVFRTSALSIKRDNETECKQTFLVQEKRLAERIGRPEFSNVERLPVVLDWGIQGYMVRSFSGISRCEKFPASSRTGWNSSSVHQCKCRWGYKGNPYDLPQGCDQDIDECNDRKNICGPDMYCRNLMGSYQCYSYSRSRNIMFISGIVIGLFCLLLVIGWWGYITLKKRKDIKLKEKYFKRNGGLLLQQQLTSFDGSGDKSKFFNSKDLDKATDHFNMNRILGQ